MRNDLPVVDQSPYDCVFALYAGEDAARFNAAHLTVHRRATMAFRDLTAEFAIIGESHFVTISRRDGVPVYAEVLACVDLDRIGGAPTDYRAFSANRGQQSWRIGATTPPVSAAAHATLVMRETIAEWADVHGSSERPHLQLSMRFPGPRAPMTLVRCVVYPDMFRIETQHEYTVAGMPIWIHSRSRIRVQP